MEDEAVEHVDPGLFTLVGLLQALIDVATFATGADLARSGSVEQRAGGDTDTIAASTNPVTLARANGRRKGLSIHNDSPATLYIKLGEGASLEDWTTKLLQDDYFERDGYRGKVTGVFSAAGTGQARVTEFGW